MPSPSKLLAKPSLVAKLNRGRPTVDLAFFLHSSGNQILLNPARTGSRLGKGTIKCILASHLIDTTRLISTPKSIVYRIWNAMAQ